MEGLDDTGSKPPVAGLPRERSNCKDDNYFALDAVHHGEWELLRIDPACAVLVGGADVGKRARYLNGCFDLLREAPPETCELALVVSRFRLEFSFRLGEEASRLHPRL